jgi:hypothetical protein
VEENGLSSELVDEMVLETAKEDEAKEGRKWHRQVALSSLVLALTAALAGLLAGLTASQELHVRTGEIMELTRLENERVHVEVLRTKHELVESLGRMVDSEEVAQIQAFEEEMEDLRAELAADDRQDRRTGSTHLILAIAVMLLSMGITLGGMAVVVEDKRLWIAGLVVGACGFLGLALGVVRMVT